MVMNNGKGYYEDISDDLLYVSQSISQKISSEDFNLSDEKEIIKDILEKLESQSSEYFVIYRHNDCSNSHSNRYDFYFLRLKYALIKGTS